MKIYRIAEMNIAVKAKYEDTYRYMQDFLTDSQDYELYIEPTDEMIRYEAELGEEIHGDAGSPYICEAVAILRVICDYIIDKGGFFLHCSCLKYKDEAIIFTAPSGTGKSTHSALWRRHFGDDVAIRSVVFLSQAPENKATPISPIDAMALLLQQTVLPSNKTALSKLLDMLGRLVENIPMYRLGCTISDEAVTTIYQEIYG